MKQVSYLAGRHPEVRINTFFSFFASASSSFRKKVTTSHHLREESLKSRGQDIGGSPRPSTLLCNISCGLDGEILMINLVGQLTNLHQSQSHILVSTSEKNECITQVRIEILKPAPGYT